MLAFSEIVELNSFRSAMIGVCYSIITLSVDLLIYKSSLSSLDQTPRSVPEIHKDLDPAPT